MELSDLRGMIDGLDERILQLLSERAQLALRIGRLKEERKLASFAPEREEEVVRRLERLNRGPLPNRALRAIYREIISACLSLQRPLRVAYLGPEATFTHLAAVKRFGRSVEYMPAKTIGEVFSEVEKGQADFGVVPVENSTEGMVSHTLDSFVESSLRICGEIFLEVSHHLLSRAQSLGEIRRVYSHPQALAQTRKWLESNLPCSEVIEVLSTAAAAQRAKDDDQGAAIASELAAELYGLSILRSRIEDYPENYTRFLVIGKDLAPRSGDDKTSILFSIRDQVGALHRILEPFAAKGINLTKIESRPSKIRAWDYIFYIDFEGYAEDEPTSEVLGELEKECVMLKVLGSYPKGKY
jgi:chorismate mutase/prephenate dehydratase